MAEKFSWLKSLKPASMGEWVFLAFMMVAATGVMTILLFAAAAYFSGGVK